MCPSLSTAQLFAYSSKFLSPVQCGHAIVGALMPEYDAVTKISIVPRGAAGGALVQSTKVFNAVTKEQVGRVGFSSEHKYET